MTEASLQSRKICFVDVESDGQEFYDQALPDCDILFADTLEDVPGDAEVLSVFIGRTVNEDFLESHPGLRIICSRSTGCDHIDMEACRRRGIIVTNAGTYGENTVAEHAFALILALSRRLRDSDHAVRSGRYSRAALQGFDLRGRTIGVVGAGRVGLHVLRLAFGFGMKLLAYDAAPHPLWGELLDFQYVSLEELLGEAHVVTLHVPLTPATHHMINRDSLKLCRPGVVIINTARGGLMDTNAVIEALDSGQIGGLGLDVLEDESVFQGNVTSKLGATIAERVRNASAAPLEREHSALRLAEFSRLVTHSRLLERPNVVLTPHVAFNSGEAMNCLRTATVESILDYLAGNPLKYRCL